MFASLFLPGPDRPAGAAAILVAIAEQFSPRYEQDRDDLLSIDVKGLTRLLGTPRAIGVELVREAAARGLQPQVAVAGARMTALVLAQMRPGLTVVASGAEAAELASVPVGALEKITGVSPPVAWATWGIRTLGELAALPASELIARLGVQAATWQAIARGEDVRPLIPARPEERFDAALELEWPIEGLEPLSFVLTRLLEPLSTRLERRDRGVAVLQVDLGLITGATHSRRLDLPSPIRDARTLRTLALLDLESHPPAAAIDRVAIVIEPTPGRVLQHMLFARAHPTPDVLSTLLARLGALMGQDRLGTPAIVETHRPGMFAMKPFALEHPSSASRDEKARGLMVSVLRRCRYPVPARVVMEQGRPVRVTTERRGFAGGNVLAAAGPWRSSGNWWSVTPASGGGVPQARQREVESLRSRPSDSEAARKYWYRDEWDVALSDGALYRLGHDREQDCWFIDGIVD